MDAAIEENTSPRWRKNGKPGTVNADRERCIDRALESGGYKIATYVYSNTQAYHETDFGDAASFFEPGIPVGYTCEVWDLQTGQLLLDKAGDGPMAARVAAMAAWAERHLGDTVDHNLGSSAADGTYVLSIGQAAASGLPIMGDLPPVIDGDDLRRWLAAKGITQGKAASMCSVPARTFRRWVAGKPKMPKGIWDLLNCKVWEIDNRKRESEKKEAENGNS